MKKLQVNHVTITKISYGRWELEFDLYYPGYKEFTVVCETTDSETIDLSEDIEDRQERYDFLLYWNNVTLKDQVAENVNSYLPLTLFDIDYIIKENYHIENRVQQLKNSGYTVVEKFMGSGGVGQVKVVDNTIRIQVSYGKGKYNLAQVVEIPKKKVIFRKNFVGI